MDGRYLAHETAHALRARFSAKTRARRMHRFLQVFPLRGGERIVDLGGVPGFWAPVSVPLDITVINLPGTLSGPADASHHRITLLEGDACATGLPDNGFDLAFSNSVIEHVGGPEHQRRMAGELRRLAPAYWVQTPSIWFPIEAHTYMPFWWFYPPPLKRVFLRRWRRRVPAWCEMIEGTTVIARADLQAMFPDGQMWTERVAGLPKSHVMHRPGGLWPAPGDGGTGAPDATAARPR